MSSLKAILTAGLIAGMNMPLLIPAANAQVAGITVTLGGVSAAAPAKGETQSLNVSQGSRTTLSVGNGVQIGTQAQMSSSIGTISLSRSVLEPTSVTLGSTISGTTHKRRLSTLKTSPPMAAVATLPLKAARTSKSTRAADLLPAVQTLSV